MKRILLLSPFCLVLFCLVASISWAANADDRARTISLASGVLDVTALQDVPEGLRTAAHTSGPEGDGEFLLVKFGGPVAASQLAALEASVERVIAYLPHDAFLVKVQSGRSLPADVAWSGAYHPAYKLGPAVTSLEADSTLGGGFEEAPVILLVQLYPDAPLDNLAEDLGNLEGLTMVGRAKGDRFSRIRLLGSAAAVVRHRETLARHPQVFWVERESRRVLLNDTTSWVGQSGLAGGQATPVHDNGLLGADQVVAVLDTGLDADMCYFHDPVQGLPPINPCDGGTLVNTNHRKVLAVNFLWSGECSGGISSSEWDNHDHGTHVAGTVAGDNLANVGSRDAGDGMAPAAKLVIQDGGIQTDNCADLPGLGCPVVDLNPIFQQTYDQGARIHTNSWGDRENFSPTDIYSAGSEDADEFMWNHKDFLLIFAAGNGGNSSGTILSPATGKNVVAVGSTLRGSSAGSLSSFSSCGPTDDGRIKPDVTAPGSSIISCNSDNNTGSNNCNTRSMSGTSMAAPGVAGLSALTREYFTAGFYPSGAANLADAFVPSGALLKAVLINSGESMPGVSAIPSNCQGWGRVLLDNALSFPAQTRKLWVEDDAAGFSLAAMGTAKTFTFDVASDLEPLEVTLTWTDFPSTPAAAAHLVNDLDLTVTGPGGTFLGNVFTGGVSATGGTADRVDTVEQVLLAAPTAGEYTVTVSAFNIPQGPQPFALVVTGDAAEQTRLSLFADGFESGDTTAWDQTQN